MRSCTTATGLVYWERDEAMTWSLQLVVEVLGGNPIALKGRLVAPLIISLMAR
jgi:hypothetical protein